MIFCHPMCLAFSTLRLGSCAYLLKSLPSKCCANCRVLALPRVGELLGNSHSYKRGLASLAVYVQRRALDTTEIGFTQGVPPGSNKLTAGGSSGTPRGGHTLRTRECDVT